MVDGKKLLMTMTGEIHQPVRLYDEFLCGSALLHPSLAACIRMDGSYRPSSRLDGSDPEAFVNALKRNQTSKRGDVGRTLVSKSQRERLNLIRDLYALNPENQGRVRAGTKGVKSCYLHSMLVLDSK